MPVRCFPDYTSVDGSKMAFNVIEAAIKTVLKKHGIKFKEYFDAEYERGLREDIRYFETEDGKAIATLSIEYTGCCGESHAYVSLYGFKGFEKLIEEVCDRVAKLDIPVDVKYE